LPRNFTTQKWSNPCVCCCGRAGPGPGRGRHQVIAHIPLSQLRALPGAPDMEDAWLRARLGEDGVLAGQDAEAAACDAPVVPVVTGSIDPVVIDEMIGRARTAADAQAEAEAGAPGPGRARSRGLSPGA